MDTYTVGRKNCESSLNGNLHKAPVFLMSLPDKDHQVSKPRTFVDTSQPQYRGSTISVQYRTTSNSEVYPGFILNFSCSGH